MNAAGPKLEIKKAVPKGRGVFARAAIARGELVAAFTGWILSTHELTDDLFALQIDHDRWLCSHGDQLDDCINHSCEPNTGFLCGETVLFALRDIAPGEEISFDYATSIAEPGWTLECACGSPGCRKLIVPWGEMPTSFRDRMRPAALQYLRKVIY
jgi:SET domain-containing protein